MTRVKETLTMNNNNGETKETDSGSEMWLRK